MAVPSIMKCPPLNEKKNHQKGASQLKITKIVHIARDTRDIEMGGKWKTKSIGEVQQRNNEILKVYYLYIKKDIFCSKT